MSNAIVETFCIDRCKATRTSTLTDDVIVQGFGQDTILCCTALLTVDVLSHEAMLPDAVKHPVPKDFLVDAVEICLYQEDSTEALSLKDAWLLL